MNHPKVLLLIILPLISLMCPGQVQNDYILTELATQRQLPVANVHCIYQDGEGYIWYGTRGGGLCRDNGYQIDVFRSDRNHPDLIGPSNDITCIAEDTHHRIIFSTKEGLYMLNKNNYTIHIVDESLRNRPTGPLLVTSDGTLWVCSNKSIFHYDPDMRLIASFPSKWQGKEAWASHIMEDSRGRIWITQWNGGVLRYNPATQQFEEQYWKEGIIPADLVEDPDNHCFWIGTWGKGIMKYEPQKQLLEEFPCTCENANMTLNIQLTKDISLQRLWTTTMYGLCAFDIVDGRLQTVSLEGILPEGMSIIDHTAFDNRGNLWVSGFSPHTFILSRPDRSIIKNKFQSLDKQLHHRPFIWNTIKEGDNLWLGQEREPIALYQPKEGTIIFDNNVSIYSRPSVVGFCKCQNGKGIWGKANNQLYHLWFDGRAIQSQVVAHVKSDIKCLADNGQGEVYIGSSEGIDVYHTATQRLSRLPVKARDIRLMMSSKNGELYVATEDNRLIRYDAHKGEQIITDKSRITGLEEDAKGTIWMTTYHGELFCYDPQTGQFEMDSNGSNSNGDHLKDLAIDTQGHIWLLSDLIIKEYNPQNGAYRIFRSSDRAIQMDCFHNVRAEDDYVRIDGAGGMLHIRPSANLDRKYSEVSPLVTSITMDGEKQMVGMDSKEVDIQPHVVNIEIQFSTLNYLHADKVTYAYRLSNVDDQWHYLPQGINKATIVLLPKGDYRMELMATDEYGCWGESTQALLLHRQPAWYESWWAYTLYLLAAILIVGSYIVYYLKRQKEKQQHRMDVQLTEMRLRFFTNISHELRTPLTLIITPLESMIRKLEQWEQEEVGNTHLPYIGNQLVMIERHARRLLFLVNHLLDFRKLEMGQQRLELSRGDVFDFIRTVCETFRPMSTEKGIGLGYAIPNRQLYIQFDSKKLQHILYNLLSNAFKFTPTGGQIAVGVSETGNDQIEITVKDTGCGISSRDLPHIFDRYYQSKATIHSSVTGTGIGLHLVHEYTELHGGTITVSSKLGEGTTFTVLLPTNLLQEDTELPASQTSPEDQALSEEKKTQKESLLIVDDNDEFREFMCNELAERYNIYQAANGEEALSIIAEYDIALMVSDVMMPVLDGMTLCQQIKQNVNTSHIMVILLTARIEEESKMEGFRAGADDYLSKPFNMEMLQLRIGHLLELRRMCNQDFIKGDEVKVEQVALNEIDQKFLRSAIEAVERNMSNAEYDVDALAADVFMSRSTLYRKIHSLTGQKPSIFIRAIRLKQAARMIKEGQYTLTEISTYCGFSTPSYFSRCFKAQYGIPPGNYN